MPPPLVPPPFVHITDDDDDDANVAAAAAFGECQTTCFVDEFLCRDGGPGSFSPALCPYSTQCRQCGTRPQVNSVLDEFAGDDSCQYANDGFCTYYAPLRPLNPTLYMNLLV